MSHRSSGLIVLITAAAMLPAGSVSGQVWTSTFDTNADGVVEIIDNNVVKEMIGSVSNGRLTITAADVSPGLLDKAGRPLGETLDGSASFSALIKFRYNFFNPESTAAWSAMGFMGDRLAAATGACCESDDSCTDVGTCDTFDCVGSVCDGGPKSGQSCSSVRDCSLCAGGPNDGLACSTDSDCGINSADCVAGGGTWQGSGVDCASVSCPSPDVADPNPNSNRQMVAFVFRHSQIGSDTILAPGIFFAGASHQGFSGGPSVNLGPDPFNKTFTLALCYRADDNRLRAFLLDENDNFLVKIDANLTEVVTGSGGLAAQKESLRLTHLGFSDYIGSTGNKVTVYEIDEMSYFRDPDFPDCLFVPPFCTNGACQALPTEPTGVCCDSLLPDCFGDDAPTDAACNTTGTCQSNVCAGGPRDGLACGDDSECAACVGGPNDGLLCDAAADCPGFDILNTFHDCEVLGFVGEPVSTENPDGPIFSLRGNGTFTAGESCDTFTCPTPPSGACCQRDGSCLDDQTFVECVDGPDPLDTSDNGIYQGDGTLCSEVDCPEPGACCLIVQGICLDNLTQAECEAPGLNQGVWQGSQTLCSGTTCPPPAEGACCAENFTCTVTTFADCTGGWCGPNTNCEGTPCRALAPIGFAWMEDFDVDQDGLELLSGDCHEIFPGFGEGYEVCYDGVDSPDPDTKVDCDDDECDGNDGTTGCCVDFKPMFGPVANSKVRVEVIENREPTAFVPDRGGRAFDTPLGGDDSFSVLYQFVWEDLPDTVASNYAAFMGETNGPDGSIITFQSRQTTGANLVHSKDSDGNFLVNMVIEMGGVGVGLPNVARSNPGALTNLGPFAERKYYQLAMGYSASTTELSVTLYDAEDTVLGENSVPLNEIFDTNSEQEVARQFYTHVGWLDYTGFGSQTTSTVWQLDRLAFYDNAFGAFRGPLTGACCNADSTCGDEVLLDDCVSAGGVFQGPNSLCSEINCPLPPCNDPAFDADADGDVDEVDFAAFQRCITGDLDPGALFDPLACHCFDHDGDQDVDGNDFQDFLACASGPTVPADPNCD